MKAKILIVDDEADLRNLLASVLEDLYEVIQANNGAALQNGVRIDMEFMVDSV